MGRTSLTIKMRLGLAALLAILIGLTVYLATKEQASSVEQTTVEQTSSSAVESEQDEISTYAIDHKAVTGDNIKELQYKVVKGIDELRNNTTYLQVLTGNNSYNMYMYNKNGEIYSQMSDGTNTSVFRTDGSLVRYNEKDKTMTVGVGIDTLSLAKNAIEAVGKNGIQVYQMDIGSEDKTVDVSEYRVDIVGDDAVKEIYKSVNDEYADAMVEDLKGQVKYLTGNSEADLHLVICYRFMDDSLMMYCYSVVDNKELLSWKTDAYAIMDTLDWKLDEAWYNDDIKTISPDEAFELKNNLVKEMSDLLDKFTSENNIPMSKKESALDINGMMEYIKE